MACSNPSDISFINQQLDREIQLTNKHIITEINMLQNAYSNGVGTMTKDLFEELYLNSEKMVFLYCAIVDSAEKVSNKKEDITRCFSHHIDLIVRFMNNDGNDQNNYIASNALANFFNDESSSNLSDCQEFINNALSQDNEDLNSVQFKMMFAQLKNLEYQTWHYFNLAISGEGAMMNEFRGILGFDEQTILAGDTIKGTIFCDAYGKNNIMKYYIGTIDWEMFGKKKNICIKPGEKTKIPIIGEYQTIEPEFRGQFFHCPSKIGFESIEGVIEVKSPQAIFYVPFKKTFQVHKKVPEYFLSE